MNNQDQDPSWWLLYVGVALFVIALGTLPLWI